MAKIRFLFCVLVFFASAAFSISGCENNMGLCSDNMTAALCVNNTWQMQNCPLGCFEGRCKECDFNATNISECLSDTSYRICSKNGFWSGGITCKEGYFCRGNKCYSPAEDRCGSPGEVECLWPASSFKNSTTARVCDMGGYWRAYDKCDTQCINGHCAECEPEGIMCSSNISYRKCSDWGEWGNDTVCSGGSFCNNGRCGVEQQCSIGEKYCILNSVFECTAHGWKFVQDCKLKNSCMQTVNGTGCFSYSKKCFGWGEWEETTRVNYTDFSADGRNRQCEKTFLKRYCLNADGTQNEAEIEENSSFSCGEYSQICAYVLVNASQTIAFAPGKREECNVSVYDYVCQPSGEIIGSKRVENESCSAWMAAGAGNGSEAKKAAPSDEYQAHFALMGIAILVLAALAWLAYAGTRKRKNQKEKR